MIETLPNCELLAISAVGHAPGLVDPALPAGLERFLLVVPAAAGA
jgi:hypothetical protein